MKIERLTKIEKVLMKLEILAMKILNVVRYISIFSIGAISTMIAWDGFNMDSTIALALSVFLFYETNVMLKEVDM